MIFKRVWALVIFLVLVCSTVQAAPVTAKLDRSSAVVGETVTLHRSKPGHRPFDPGGGF
jgi:hypothetical protein